MPTMTVWIHCLFVRRWVDILVVKRSGQAEWSAVKSTSDIFSLSECEDLQGSMYKRLGHIASIYYSGVVQSRGVKSLHDWLQH